MVRRRTILVGSNGRATVVDPVFLAEKACVGPLFHVGENRAFDAFGMAVERYGQELLRNMYPLSGAVQLYDRLRCPLEGIDEKGEGLELADAFLDGAGIVLGGDSATGLAVDSSGKAYIDGVTYSKKFPTTAGAFQSNNNTTGMNNAFVSAIDPPRSRQVPSSGRLISAAPAIRKQNRATIALDQNGNVWTTGLAFSYNAHIHGFPTMNPFQSDKNASPATFAGVGLPAIGASNLFCERVHLHRRPPSLNLHRWQRHCVYSCSSDRTG